MGRNPSEPIAVVGMAMRFPGGSHSSAQFWDMLCKGRSASRPIPKDRFDNAGYYHPDGARAGSVWDMNFFQYLLPANRSNRSMSEEDISLMRTHSTSMLRSFQ